MNKKELAIKGMNRIEKPFSVHSFGKEWQKKITCRSYLVRPKKIILRWNIDQLFFVRGKNGEDGESGSSQVTRNGVLLFGTNRAVLYAHPGKRALAIWSNWFVFDLWDLINKQTLIIASFIGIMHLVDFAGHNWARKSNSKDNKPTSFESKYYFRTLSFPLLPR